MWRYARGVALAKLGPLDEAAGEIKGIDGIERQGRLASLTSAGIPATGVLNLARELIAPASPRRVATRQRRSPPSSAPRCCRTGFPIWSRPIGTTPCGNRSVAAGRIDDTEAAFRDTLRQTPNNGWALYGLVEVAKARGDGPRQQEEEARLARAWIGDRSLLDLKRL